MPDYRLYLLNDRGHIHSAKDLQCSSDEEAVEKAEQFRDGRALELWQQARFIKKIPKLPKS